MQTEHLFELTYILLEKKNITARKLSQHFGVSTRTIYRWLDALNVAGVPVYCEKGKGGGIRLSDSYTLDKALLTDEEKREILSSVQALENLSGNKSSAITKLNAFSKSQKSWIEIEFDPWNPKGREIKNLFNIIRLAIFDSKKVLFDYCSSGGLCCERTVHPWKIIFRGQAWYLFGYCELKKEARFFKLNRMRNIRILSDEACVSENDVVVKDDYGGYSEENVCVIELVIKVQDCDVYRILDDFVVEKIEDCSNGFKILTMKIPQMYWLYDWLLSFADRIEVLAPESVKAKFEGTIQNMWNNLQIKKQDDV